jgi:hypothetical protein
MAWYDALLQMGAVPAGATAKSIDPYGSAVSSPVETALRFYKEQGELAKQRREEQRIQEAHDARMSELASTSKNKYSSTSDGIPKTSVGQSPMVSQKTLAERMSEYKTLRDNGYSKSQAYEATLKGTGLAIPGQSLEETKTTAEIAKTNALTEAYGKAKGLTAIQQEQRDAIENTVLAKIQAVGKEPDVYPQVIDGTPEEVWTAAIEELKATETPDPTSPKIQAALAETAAQIKRKKASASVPPEKKSNWLGSLGAATMAALGIGGKTGKPADYTGAVSSGMPKYKYSYN